MMNDNECPRTRGSGFFHCCSYRLRLSIIFWEAEVFFATTTVLSFLGCGDDDTFLPFDVVFTCPNLFLYARRIRSPMLCYDMRLRMKTGWIVRIVDGVVVNFSKLSLLLLLLLLAEVVVVLISNRHFGSLVACYQTKSNISISEVKGNS